VSDGVPVIAVGNVTNAGFQREGLYFVTPSKAAELQRFNVEAGDVLFARSGATTGKVCVAPPEVRGWRMTGHILRLRLDANAIRPHLAMLALSGAPPVRAQVFGSIRGATRPGFNTGLLESVFVPIPPVPEQDAILGAIARLDVLNTRRSFNRQLIETIAALDRAVRACAFRGALVPQDRSDEPDATGAEGAPRRAVASCSSTIDNEQ
jgi:type I restriction enzyme S subunit